MRFVRLSPASLELQDASRVGGIEAILHTADLLASSSNFLASRRRGCRSRLQERRQPRADNSDSTKVRKS